MIIVGVAAHSDPQMIVRYILRVALGCDPYTLYN